MVTMQRKLSLNEVLNKEPKLTNFIPNHIIISSIVFFIALSIATFFFYLFFLHNRNKKDKESDGNLSFSQKTLLFLLCTICSNIFFLLITCMVIVIPVLSNDISEWNHTSVKNYVKSLPVEKSNHVLNVEEDSVFSQKIYNVTFTYKNKIYSANAEKVVFDNKTVKPYITFRYINRSFNYSRLLDNTSYKKGFDNIVLHLNN